MVAGAGVRSGGVKREIHAESASLCSGLTVSAVATPTPDVGGTACYLLLCSQHPLDPGWGREGQL